MVRDRCMFLFPLGWGRAVLRSFLFKCFVIKRGGGTTPVTLAGVRLYGGFGFAVILDGGTVFI